MRRALAAALLATGVGLPLAVQAACPAPVTDQSWYLVSIDGRPAGSGHESTHAGEHGTRTSTSEMHIALRRLATRLELSEIDKSLEDADGRLLHLESELRTSMDATRLVLEVVGDRLQVTSSAGGRSYRREIPGPHALLGPEGVRERTCAWLAAPTAALEYEVFLPDVGQAVQVTRQLRGSAPPGADGRARYRVEQRTAGVAQLSSLVIDATGTPLEEAADTPLGRMALTRTSAAQAAQADAGAELGEDAYARSVVASNLRLPGARELPRLRVRLRRLTTDVDWPELAGPGQRVVAADADSRLLEISVAHLSEDPPASAAADDPDLQANVLLQSDHPDVVAVARSLRRPGLGAFAQARLAQDWVATHLQFDAGLAVVPAGEAVRDRRGTCVAYAVLTASLARALGIPARVVLGYVYIANAFVGHAWTEVRVGAAWVALDAALYRAGPADAARIALVRHGGELGIASGAAELSRLMGAVSIRIEGFERHARWIEVAPDAASWSLRDRHYQNPALGLELDAPAGYAFERLDEHYPEALVLALHAAPHAQVQLRQLSVGVDGPAAASLLQRLGYPAGVDAAVAGRAGRQAVSGPKRALAFADGPDLWLLESDGVDAATFAAIARSLRLAP